MTIERYPEFLRGMAEQIDKFLDKRIAVYGLGFYTEECIRCFPQLEIKGLMDGFKENGEAYGRRIMSCGEVLAEGVDCIVIAARPASVRVIYRRIEDFCNTNQIELYDIYGNDLCHTDRKKERRNFPVCERRKLEKLIRRADVVCFDVFDTLLIREVPEPQDIFYWIEQYKKPPVDGFARLRAGAEHEILGSGPASLADIYGWIEKGTLLTRDECSDLAAQEIRTEKDFLRIRAELKRTYDRTVELGKKIYLISDMYLSKKVIGEILWDLGIRKYDDLFISCEYGKTKRQGLFSLVKELEKGRTILHIGDDWQADIEAAGNQGIDAFWIPSVNELMENSDFEELIGKRKSLSEGIQTKKFACKLFQNPFDRYTQDGKVVIDSPYDLGYAFFAPLITLFALWMFREWKEDGIECVLFGARDGYLLHKLYQIYSDMFPEEKKIKNIYFYISRKAGMLANMEEAGQIQELGRMNFTGSPEQMLRNRFGLEDSEILPYKGQEVSAYVEEHVGLILERTVIHKKNYLKYIDNLNIGDMKKIAFVDFASTGTCQMSLEQLWGRKVEGFYFKRLKCDNIGKRNLSVRSFMSGQVTLEALFPLLEAVIASWEPMLSGFTENGKPSFSKEYRNTEQLRTLKEVQNGITDYFKEWIRLGIPTDRGSIENAAAILESVSGKNTEWPAAMCSWKETDEFYGREIRLSDLYS